MVFFAGINSHGFTDGLGLLFFLCDPFHIRHDLTDEGGSVQSIRVYNFAVDDAACGKPLPYGDGINIIHGVIFFFGVVRDFLRKQLRFFQLCFLHGAIRRQFFRGQIAVFFYQCIDALSRGCPVELHFYAVLLCIADALAAVIFTAVRCTRDGVGTPANAVFVF